MAHLSWSQLKSERTARMTGEERKVFERAYAEAALAAAVGERIRQARESAGLSQRQLAQRMGTSQAAIARLEAGGVGATLTTLHRAAVALELELTVELRPSA